MRLRKFICISGVSSAILIITVTMTSLQNAPIHNKRNKQTASTNTEVYEKVERIRKLNKALSNHLPEKDTSTVFAMEATSTTTTDKIKVKLETPLFLGVPRKSPLVTIGIPSIRRRRHTYLNQTLHSLVNGLNNQMKKRINIVVYLAEQNVSFVQEQINIIRQEYGPEIRERLLRVLVVHESKHSDWQSKLFLNFDDSLSRVRWRSKQNLDMIFLLSQILQDDDPEYFLMLEDDVIANEGYLDDIMLYVDNKSTKDWDYCSFSEIGGAGKLFHRESAQEFLAMLKLFWYAKPLDWLLWDYIRVKHCGFSETADTCEEKVQKRARKYFASLFKHKGIVSSRTNPMFNAR